MSFFLFYLLHCGSGGHLGSTCVRLPALTCVPADRSPWRDMFGSLHVDASDGTFSPRQRDILRSDSFCLFENKSENCREPFMYQVYGVKRVPRKKKNKYKYHIILQTIKKKVEKFKEINKRTDKR